MVIHGAIDGYNRVITMLKVSDNNRSETILQHFQHSLQRWPLPSRLRTDRGGENVPVGRPVLERLGEISDSWIQRPSVHNQQIEPL